MPSRYHFIFIFFIIIFCQSCNYDVFIAPQQIYLQQGDSIKWASPHYNHSHWQEANRTKKSGRFWMRSTLKFDSSEDYLHGLHIDGLASMNVYWDGHLIHSNGKVGNNKSDEIEGTLMSNVMIPDSLVTQGKHTIAIQASNFHQNMKNSFIYFYVANYTTHQ